MTSRLVLSKKDPRKTDFRLVPLDAVATTYASDTFYFPRTGRNGRRATTTVTRTDPAAAGDRLQVGVIEWPVDAMASAQLVVGTRDVRMSKTSTYTAQVVSAFQDPFSSVDMHGSRAWDRSERFTAADGFVYEWQIHDARPQLVPLRTDARPNTSYVATFVQSQSGFCFWRKHTSSLFIPPEGYHILDDIVVTFIYFECKWRDKEGDKARASLSGSLV